MALTQLEPGDVWLPHPELGGERALRQAVVGAVADDRPRDRPRQRRPLAPSLCLGIGVVLREQLVLRQPFSGAHPSMPLSTLPSLVSAARTARSKPRGSRRASGPNA